jgi:hypothetical protein
MRSPSLRSSSGSTREGTELNQADFLLTLDVGLGARRSQATRGFRAARCHATIFRFSARRRSTTTSAPGRTSSSGWSSRAAFGRGRLRAAYQVLRGKNAETGESSTEQREANFERLAGAQQQVLDLHNWHEFLHASTAPGSARTVRSCPSSRCSRHMRSGSKGANAVWRTVCCRTSVARWFFMSQVTGRYSGSSEARFEQDLRTIAEASGADGWVEVLEEGLQLEMSEDFFRNRLVSNLDARSWRNLALLAYEASLVILDAPMLFSPTGETVSSRLDPKVVTVRGVERHHLFPKNWIRTSFGATGHKLNGLADRPANASWVDWIENNEISDRAPFRVLRGACRAPRRD